MAAPNRKSYCAFLCKNLLEAAMHALRCNDQFLEQPRCAIRNGQRKQRYALPILRTAYTISI